MRVYDAAATVSCTVNSLALLPLPQLQYTTVTADREREREKDERDTLPDVRYSKWQTPEEREKREQAAMHQRLSRVLYPQARVLARVASGRCLVLR